MLDFLTKKYIISLIFCKDNALKLLISEIIMGGGQNKLKRQTTSFPADLFSKFTYFCCFFGVKR